MPEERGSIYKSTANEIGEALKAKLGGEGFAPKDWSDNLNLLGIASEDTEAAINSLKESEGSGERGSILLSTANAIGSMLNKKYNSQRGFSPAEWASATRKMKALETDTKSGGIVTFSDGADDVPLKKCEIALPASLDGYSEVDVVSAGKNLWEFGDNTVDTIAYIILYFSTPIPAGTYTVSCELISTTTNCSFRFRKEDGSYIESATFQANVGRVSKKIILPEPAYRVYLYSSTQGSGEVTTWKNVQIEVGEAMTDFKPYSGDTYTADLGRTIYGGTADVVNGQGTSTHEKVKVSDLTWTKQTASERNFYLASSSIMTGSTNKVILCDMLPYGGEITVGAMEDKSLASWQKTLRIYDTDIDDVTELISTYGNAEIVYPLETERDFTFDPIPINTSGDTENFYTSNGDTSITYYEEPTAYTRGTASGGVASFSGANTEFPFTKLKATIAPSVEGVSSVVVKNEGKNLLDFNAFSDYSNWETDITENQSYPTSSANRGLLLDLPQGTYTISFGIDSETYPTYLYLCKDDGSASTRLIYFTGANFSVASGTFTVDGVSKYYIRMGSTGTEESFDSQIEKISWGQIEVGSSSTEYAAYKAPTVYTADLGETVYGGSVDFVSGEVIGNEGKTVLDDSGWTYYPVGGANTFNKIIPFAKVGGSGILDGYNFQNVQYISQQPDKTFYFFASGTNSRISIRDDSYTNANDFAAAINNKVLLFELATPTESSIDPKEIYPREGVNNIWNDANGITEVGYFGE